MAAAAVSCSVGCSGCEAVMATVVREEVRPGRYGPARMQA